MKGQAKLRLKAFAMLILIACLSAQSRAQEDDAGSYKIGERVEYKDLSYPEDWKQGTVVKIYLPARKVCQRHLA